MNQFKNNFQFIVVVFALLFAFACLTTTTVAANTAITFTANATRLENSHSFLGTCQIVNFEKASTSHYTVNYYRGEVGSRKTLIGGHEIFAPISGQQRHVFNFVRQHDMEVHSGPRFVYPTFDVVVSPTSVSTRQEENFWCELNDLTSSSLHLASNLWPYLPLLTLSIFADASSPSSAHQYIARCRVDNYKGIAHRPHTVQLLLLVGFEKPAVLGTYQKSSTSSEEEFVPSAGYVHGIKVVSHGSHGQAAVTFPDFEFLVKATGSRMFYYQCQLKLTDHDQKQGAVNGQFTSNKILHV